ncbi:ABC transporter ATP-binding protein [Clostridium magnum]|uniref:Oligopeptide transport ATP-binding protein OppF n=1 Tax=Clostridium magnum DSM 2767 TaxID=1121326 RepID=A0A162T4M2_9CLOT|nr:ATP-binding cassette domain-containing protein [Clostridium magnum]KZL92240.1 oligopeptide transport ATP-binding protein OppF [Clostridium magnum DSM 2767]SHH16614.1 peptide/nickel transport system ATP-binding protein [Clostridium magnum DSM 2767]
MENILTIQGLKKVFGKFSALKGVSFDLIKGETFGLVGESGSGKSTIANTIIGIHSPTEGEVSFNGTKLWKGNKYSCGEYGKIQIVFQDPRSSLDPRMTVRKIITEPLIPLSKERRKDKGSRENLVKLMKSVGLKEEQLDRYPHEFSGGQRQRIAIARAIITDPEVLILDEPTSALDVSVQAQILNLLKEIQKQKKMTYLFISHNMAVIKYVSNRVGVLYKGDFVEMGNTKDVFNCPKHDYTKKLIFSIIN